MKKRTAAFALLMSALAVSGACASDKGTASWQNGVIEATGEGVVPSAHRGTARGRLLAKRGAMLDLQRNVLELVRGAHVEASTTMKSFEADDSARSRTDGFIKGIEVTAASFDGETFTLVGRLCLGNPGDPDLSGREKER